MSALSLGAVTLAVQWWGGGLHRSVSEQQSWWDRQGAQGTGGLTSSSTSKPGSLCKEASHLRM